MTDLKLDKIVSNDRIWTQSGWSKWVPRSDSETNGAEYPDKAESLT